MEQAKVIILAGQSNAVGVGHIEYLGNHFSPEKVKEYETGYADIPIIYYSHDKHSDGFVPTTLNCTELTKRTFGPEVGMAETLQNIGTKEKFFLVKCAFGGASLWNDWLSPSGGDEYDPAAYADQVEDVIDALNNGNPLRPGWCYNELVKLLKESLDDLTDKGYDPIIRGFCWMQGETDACCKEHSEHYIETYDALLRDFRNTFGEYLSDCVFADGGISEVWGEYLAVNRAKAEYAASHTDCVYIDTVAEGLTTKNEPEGQADFAHYDSDSVIRLGKLFIEALHIQHGE